MLAGLSMFFGVAGVAWAATTVSGANVVGPPGLTAQPDTAGDPVAWFDCNSSQQPTSATLASGDSYTPAETDVGSYLCAQDTTSGNVGSTSGPITDPHETGPAITGTAQQGQTLSISANGSWTDSPDGYGYQWVDCSSGGSGCTAIPDATGPTYQLQRSDIGHDVELQETPTYGGTPASGATTQSAYGDDVIIAAPTGGSPTISGSARQGQTLTAASGGWTNTPTSYSFQWLQCSIACTAIPGATGDTYRLTDANVGASLAVTVTAYNGGGSGTATSSRTAIVSATTTTALTASASSAHVNQSLTLEAFITSSADTADPDGSVTFYDDGTAIPGCVGVSASGSSQGIAVSCSTSFGVGSQSLTAAFSPNTGSPLAGSSSASQTVQIAADDSTLTLDVPSEAPRRQPVTYTASVTPADDLTGPVVPGGTVRFLDNGHTIRGCANVRLHDGGATCTTQYRSTGRQRITARYLGSANFHGSSSRTRTVHIVRALPRRAITATMQWTFHYTPAFTRILALQLNGVAAHSQVALRCSGRGCPFHSRLRSVAAARATLDLESSFRGRRLRVGSKVIVEVTRSRYVGKYYRFTILARHQPAVFISCLAPGSDRPGVGCRR